MVASLFQPSFPVLPTAPPPPISLVTERNPVTGVLPLLLPLRYCSQATWENEGAWLCAGSWDAPPPRRRSPPPPVLSVQDCEHSKCCADPEYGCFKSKGTDFWQCRPLTTGAAFYVTSLGCGCPSLPRCIVYLGVWM
jgi:hypothetical protein